MKEQTPNPPERSPGPSDIQSDGQADIEADFEIISPEQPVVRDNEQVLAQLMQSFRNGASWFYWIAGLSLINSILLISGSDISFAFGLGLTTIVSAFAAGFAEAASAETAMIINVLVFVFSAIIAAVCAGVGWLSNRGHGWIYVIGIIVYTLDSLIFLIVQDWFSIAFHAFALAGMIGGCASLRKINALGMQGQLRTMMSSGVPPQPTDEN